MHNHYGCDGHAEISLTLQLYPCNVLAHRQLLGWYGSSKLKAVTASRLIALPLGPKCSGTALCSTKKKTKVKRLRATTMHWMSFITYMVLLYNFYGKNRDMLKFANMIEGSSDNASYAPFSRRKAAQALQDHFRDTSGRDNDMGRHPLISNIKGCDGHPELEQFHKCHSTRIQVHI